MMRAGISGLASVRRIQSSGSGYGFSLIEVAVVMFILVLLLGSILVPLSAQVEQRQVGDTQKALEEIRDALLGFAVANGYLPCPDTGTNGSENAGATACSTITSNVACGRIPHVTLGVSNSDLWGNRITYCVNEQFARRGSGNTFALTTTGTDIRICSTAATCSSSPISTSAAFAVVSHGSNGYGATNLNTGSANPAAPHADERENYDNNDRDIVWRVRTTTDSAAGEFDDIVVWLTRYSLFNRMVAAGKLP